MTGKNGHGGAPAADDVDHAETFEVRDADILVVSYPEVTIPIANYSGVKVGGLIYTRKLLAGDDAGEQYDRIYAFLKSKADADGRAKVAAYQAELKRLRAGA
jgi:hypothetical protein